MIRQPLAPTKDGKVIIVTYIVHFVKNMPQNWGLVKTPKIRHNLALKTFALTLSAVLKNQPSLEID